MADSATTPTRPEINNNASTLETTAAKHSPSDGAAAPDSDGTEGPPSKRARLEDASAQTDERDSRRRRGVAPVKPEYALCPSLCSWSLRLCWIMD